MKDKTVIIVGAGFFGLTCAYLLKDRGFNTVILEKQNELGGASASFYKDSIEVHKFGSHIFHTSYDDVWELINRFTDFNDYRHITLTKHNQKTYSIPICLPTINKFFGTNFNSLDAKKFVTQKLVKYRAKPKNLEEQALSTIGSELYEAFFKNYTKKQWDQDPKNLPTSIIKRIPIRFDNNIFYFDDKYEGIPKNGYNSLFESLVLGQKIIFNTDFNNPNSYFFREKLKDKFKIIYTGPLDEYFDFEFGELNWRSLDFEIKTLKIKNFQNNSIINYADIDKEWTRIHEFKHYQKDKKSFNANKTVIMKEFPRAYKRGKNYPFYPTNLLSDKEILKKYKNKIANEKNVYFGGRLGEYAYNNMDITIKNAIELTKTIK
jgi:UDP-galactopyranose mutase